MNRFVRAAGVCVALVGIACNAPVSRERALAFDGRLIARVGSDIVELKAGRETRKMASSVIANDAGSPSVSPDQRYLVYSRGEETVLHDLRSGETRVLLPHRSQSIMWAPDSSRFAYLRGKQTPGGCWELLVADLSGSSRHIHEDKPAPYVTTGGMWGSAKMPTPKCSATIPEAWIASDRFLFSRFLGEWPSEFMLPTMPPDTTTLGHRSSPPRIGQSPINREAKHPAETSLRSGRTPDADRGDEVRCIGHGSPATDSPRSHAKRKSHGRRTQTA